MTGSCYTYLGKPSSGARTIYLASDCCQARTPAHEAMHAMGRAHEQSRPDRDSYITIDPKNTCNKYIVICYIVTVLGPTQMEIMDGGLVYGISYDYESVMHYSQWQCAYKENGYYHPSMTFPAGVDPDKVGQRTKLSAKDLEHIKRVHCPSKQCEVYINYTLLRYDDEVSWR